jgi:hypothetical protein
VRIRVWKIAHRELGQRTLGAFLEPVALPCGKGAGAAFLPFGGIFSSRLSLRTETISECSSTR